MEPILKIDHVSFSYYTDTGETKVLNDISFSIEPESFTAIVGPSGCGKSTILSLIADLQKPTEGFITMYSPDFKRTKIGYMLQQDHLLPWRSVMKNILLGLEINHCITDQNLQYIDHLLKEYGLIDFVTKKPSELSGGMKQRIALIRTLALKPDILLLDEPFSALDYQTRLSVSTDVYEMIKKEKKTAILVTHDIAEAISLADKVIVLSSRPSTVKDTIPITFERSGIHPVNVRNTALFQEYFKKIWEELSNDRQT